jgi:hypothetical protein
MLPNQLQHSGHEATFVVLLAVTVSLAAPRLAQHLACPTLGDLQPGSHPFDR